MNGTLNKELTHDLLQRGFSRRSLGRVAALMSAGAALPLFTEPGLAQLSQVKGMPADAVKINANENPLGPCAEAADAIHNIVKKGGRYMYELGDEFRETLAAQEGVMPAQVQPYPGSSQPLHQAVM